MINVRMQVYLFTLLVRPHNETTQHQQVEIKATQPLMVGRS